MKKLNRLLFSLSTLFVMSCGGDTATGAKTFEAANDTANETPVQRATKAVVKVYTLNDEGVPMGSGSGTMIDSRGYVLTNFHVVGRMIDGSLRNQEGKVQIGTINNGRETVTANWIGKIVRTAPRLDLALIRITTDAGGFPFDKQFNTIPLVTSESINVGGSVSAIGFPSGVRSVNVSAGTVTGFETNLNNRVVWLRTDAEINPGNSGGQLIDAEGRLVGIPTEVIRPEGERATVYETMGFARSTDVIPQAWLDELSSGEITDYQQHGVYWLESEAPTLGKMVGNDWKLGSPEIHYYNIPSGVFGTIIIEPAFTAEVYDKKQEGKLTDSSEDGVLEITSDFAFMGILFPQDTIKESANYSIKIDVKDRPTVAKSDKGTQSQEQTSASATGFTITGNVIDAVTGSGLEALMIVGSNGTDQDHLSNGVSLWFDDKISDDEFTDQYGSFWQVDPNDGFHLYGIPAGKYPLRFFAAGYQPDGGVLTGGDGDTIDIGLIKLTK